MNFSTPLRSPGLRPNRGGSAFCTLHAVFRILHGCTAAPLHFLSKTIGVLFVLFVMTSTGSAFTDVPATSPYKSAVDYFVANGVIKGCTEKRFCTDYSLNRAEATKIIVLASGATLTGGDFKNCFTDVHEEWYAKYICYAKSKGLVTGYADGTFRPGQTVNRAEAIKMTLQARNIVVAGDGYTSIYSDLKSGDWFYRYVTWSSFHNLLLETGKFEAARIRTRGEFVLSLYRLVAVQELRKSVYSTELDMELVGRPLRAADDSYFTGTALCAATGGVWTNDICRCTVGRLWQELVGCKVVAGNAGAVCGGIAALPCVEGLICRMQFSYPDASGECVTAEKPGTITAAELKQGWYYGYSDQKKSGTPPDWIWIGGGKESRWKKP